MRPRRSLALAAALALLAGTAACSTQDPTPSPTTPTETTGSAEPTATATEAGDDDGAPEPVEIPDTPVGALVTWTLAGLEPGATVDVGEAETWLGPEPAGGMAPADLVTALGQVGAGGPWTAQSYQGDERTALVELVTAAGDRLDLSAALDEEDRIAQLVFLPGLDHEPATSWEELTTAVEALPAETTLVVTDVSDPAAPSSVTEVGEQDARPVGSIVKLYVLGAVVRAVEAGTLTWDQPLTVTDDVRSLPSGELQDAPTGTQVSVQDAALTMISISDNTATDMLVQAVGREAVEAELVAAGHHDPSLNTPLLTTRELFTLGWGDGGAQRAAWAGADEQGRRDLLAALPGGVLAVTAADVAAPVWQDGLDWFATPADLVAVHLELQELAATPAGAPLAEILGTNPALDPTTAQALDAVAFKGGSSMGVLALSWYVRSGEQAWVVSLQARSDDPATTLDDRPFIATAGDALALLLAP